MAESDAISFTRSAANRIADAVLVVENQVRDGGNLDFGSPGPAGPRRVFRVCTFTGAWAKTSIKTVTFRNQTTTPNTVSATNLFAAIAGVTATSTSRACAIAKDGTAWYLIAAEC
jgi:hypothetical protein